MSKQLVALLFLLVGTIPLPAQKVLAGNSTIPTAEPFPSPAIHALQIASGDLLDLEVFDTPELSAKLRVDEHGAIALPVAGTLSVLGLTAEEAGQAIEARFRDTDVLKDPHVSVTEMCIRDRYRVDLRIRRQ